MWNGFEIKEFEFEGKDARIVFPHNETAEDKKNIARADGRWLLKTEYWGAFPEVEIEMLKRGFHLVSIQNISRFATEEDCERKARLVKFISETYNLRDKCVIVGYSLGGAHAFNFAGFHPECVSCIYVDAPVLNFCDYPGRMPSEECEGVWENEFIYAYPGVSRAMLLDFKNHPINKVPVLKEHKIPIIMLYGSEDMSVNYHLNGRLLEMEYKDNDLLKVIPRALQGHHPHGGLYDKTELIEFILDKSK